MTPLLLWALLLGLAVAEDKADVTQLVYRYEAQIATGSPQSSQLWSDLKMTANLTLKIRPPHVVALLEDVSLQKMDKFLTERTPNFFMQPKDELLNGIEVDIESTMIAPLREPFYFNWSNGHVVGLKFNRFEPLFSMNIKKGILNLLHVNLDNLYSVSVNKDKSSSVTGQKESYTVLEPSSYGRCLTRYTPELLPDKPAAVDVFYLVKVRNYTSCYLKAPMAYSFDNLQSGNNKSTEHLNQQSEVKYSIVGNKYQFKILTAIGQSKLIVTPYARKDGAIETSANQTMYLLEESQSDKSLPSIQNEQTEDLRMRMPIESVEDRTPYSRYPFVPRTDIPWTARKMNQLLTLIANQTNDYPTAQVLPVTQTLMDMIRQSNERELWKLVNKAFSKKLHDPIAEVKRKVLWGLLSNAGSTTPSKVLLHLCLMQRLTTRQCISVVTAIGLYTPPSERLIHLLIKLIVNTKGAKEADQARSPSLLQQKKVLVEVTILALGSVLGRAEEMVNDIEKFVKQEQEVLLMIHKQSNVQDAMKRWKKEYASLTSIVEAMKQKHQEIVINVKEEVFEVLQKSGMEILLLKTLRNAHLPQTLEIVSLMLRTDRDLLVRVTAAQTLETFMESKHAALSLLETVMKNQREKPSVRIQAFRSMVTLKPPIHMLLRLAESIPHDKDKQFTTYVWSVFNQRANSTFRPYRLEASKFRQAMPYIQPVEYGLQDSQHLGQQLELADEVTVLNEASWVAAPDTSYNMDVSTKLDIFGTSNKALQLSIYSQGLLKVIKNMVGPYGYLSKGNSLLDLLKRNKRDAQQPVSEQISQILKELKTEYRDIFKVSEVADLQVMNKVVRLFRWSDLTALLQKEPFLVVNIDEDRLKQGVPIDMEDSGIISQFYMELPTPCGFPVNLQMGLSYSGQINGSVSMSVKESVYKMSRGNMPPMSLDLSLELQPRMIGALTGKMCVDGYLYQTGIHFESVTSLQTAFNTSVVMDLNKNRLTGKLTPSVSSDVPMLKMEIKPIVYSLAVSRDLIYPSKVAQDMDVQDTDNRPLFITMQPMAIGLDAILKQAQYQPGKKSDGYYLTLQAQYPVKALEPRSAAWPMLGRAHYSMYLDCNLQYPPELVADIRVFGRYRYEQKACDSWHQWQCYSMDEDSPAPVRPEMLNISESTGKVKGIPDLSTRITLPQLKKDIYDTVGEKMPPKISKTEWGFVAVFNGTRSTAVKGVGQSWNKGQYHASIITVNSVPIYNPRAKDWKMAIKNSAIYPGQKMGIRTLLSNIYQQNVHDKIYTMLQRKEHKVVNRYLQRLLFSYVNEGAVRRLPSMDPQVMLDRIMPEFVLMSKSPKVIEVHRILKYLLPLTHQIIELDHLLTDALQISINAALLKDMQQRVMLLQDRIKELLEKIETEKSPEELMRPVIDAAEYTVLKMSQSVTHLRETILRALHLELLDHYKPKLFLLRSKRIDRKQETIYKLCRTNFYSNDLNQNQEVIDEFDGVTGYESKENIQRPVQEEIILDLKKMLNQQLAKIDDIWKNIIDGKKPEHSLIEPLIENAANNVTQINKYIQQASLSKNRTVTALIMQASIQHMIIQHLLHVSYLDGYGNYSVTDFDRYSIKVQTKELLERASILRQQWKRWSVCSPHLNLSEQAILKELHKIDRSLVAVQHEDIRLPTTRYPWTTSSVYLTVALDKLEPALQKLEDIRDQMLVTSGAIPHPSVVSKLVGTATTLQDRVSIFKRTLLAQAQKQLLRSQITQRYMSLDDGSMNFVLSLAPVFEMYTNCSTTEKDLFSQEEIVISQSLMEVSDIRYEQHVIQKKLDEYIDQPDSRESDDYKEVISAAYQNNQRVMKKLKDATVRLQSAMATAQPMSAYATYQQYLKAYDQEMQFYETLMTYLHKYPEIRRELNEKVPKELEDVKALKNRLQELTNNMEGVESPPASGSSSVESMEDIEDEDVSFDSSEDLDPLQEDELAELQPHPPTQKLLKTFPKNLSPLYDGITFYSNVTIGSRKYMAIKAYAKKSVEQLAWEMTQFYASSRDYDVSQTVEDAIEGRELMEKRCQNTCLRLNSYDHVHLQVSSATSQLPVWVTMGVNKVMQWSLAKYYDRSEVLAPQPFIRPGTLQTILDISHLEDSVDEYYMTEKKTLAVKTVPLCPYFKAINPFQNAQNLPTLLMKQSTRGQHPAECLMQHGNMKTVDGYMYVPLLRNKALLAADCSSDKTFAILIEPIEDLDQSQESSSVEDHVQNNIISKKKITILAEEREVALKPGSMSVIASVDEQVVNPQVNKPNVTTVKLEYDVEQVILAIGQEEDGKLLVDYPRVGLRIHMGVDYLSVQMSGIYSNQLCGLCGNFDGQTPWELESPKKYVFFDVDDFVQSYTLKN